MSTPKNRGEIVSATESIALTIQVKNNQGLPQDLDSVPSVSLVSPSGLVVMNPTSAGVERLGPGNYQFIYNIPYNGPYGVWTDVWQGSFSGSIIEKTGQFIVSYTQYYDTIQQDGYYKLGVDYGFNFSQTSIPNINKILKALKARLNSSGKAKVVDGYGNEYYVDCDIFSTDTLITFICMALSKFNQTPYKTHFTFDDTDFIGDHLEILTRLASLHALSSKALIERGAEYQITDSGINFNPPSVAEMLNTQFNTELTQTWTELDLIKSSMRPHPMSLGIFSMNSGSNTQFARLRHKREGRFF